MRLIIQFLFLFLFSFSNYAENLNYEIVFSQKTPAKKSFGITKLNNKIWTTTKIENSRYLIAYDPYNYKIGPKIKAKCSWVAGLTYIKDKLVVLCNYMSSKKYALQFISPRTKEIEEELELDGKFGIPTGIACKDSVCYYSSVNPAAVNIYSLKDKTSKQLFKISPGKPHGITIKGSSFWISINEFQKAVKIKEFDFKTFKEKGFFEFNEAISSVTGLELIDDYIWAISPNINRIFKLDITKGEKPKESVRTWLASENEIMKRYRENANFGLDEKAVQKEPIKKKIFLNPDLELPEKFSWTTYDNINWVTPVKDQGKCGSCVAFGSTALIETQASIDHNLPNFNLNLSEQMAFSCIESKCSRGTGMTYVLEYVLKNGLPDEACYPYKSALGEDFECISCVEDKKRRIHLDEIFYVTDYGFGYLPEIKAALLRGPLITNMYVFKDFFSYKSGVYKHNSGKYAGQHIVMIVGYDDSTNSFLVKNSWGKKWGENGYFRIDYNDVSSIGAETMGTTTSRIENPFNIVSPSFLEKVFDKHLDLILVGNNKNYNLLAEIRTIDSENILKTFNIFDETIDISSLKPNEYDLFIYSTNDEIRATRFKYALE